MSDPRLSLGAGVVSGAGDAVLSALDALRPVIRVGAALDLRSGAAVGALYSLLIRLFPYTTIEGNAPMGPNPWGATSLADLPQLFRRAWTPGTRAPVRDLVIGCGADVVGAELWMGGDDWTADIGRSPRVINGGRLGLGLQAAAVLVAAEITKIALGTLGMRHLSFGDGLVWNLVDYRLRPAPDVPRGTAAPVLTAWFGAGSVGSSAAGVLVCTGEVRGSASVVDRDNFDPSRNTFRYPVSVGTEAGPKATWVANTFAGAGWSAHDVIGSVADWVRAQPKPGFDGIAISSVDRVDGRLEVADALAATTLSVGVDGLALHIQREHAFDNFACPYCDFVSLDPPMGQIDSMAEFLRLPPPRVARLLLEADTLTAEDIALVVAAGRIRAERSENLLGRRIEDLVRRTYAEISIQTTEGAPAAVSAAYVSWMGGVLIAAELTKAALGLPMVDRRVDLDLSGVPLEGVRRRPRDKSGNCICASPHRRRWTARLYGDTWNSTMNCGQASRQEPLTGGPSTGPTGR